MSRLSNAELEKKYKEVVSKTSCFTLESISNVNHKPHPFMIGARHVDHAAKYHGGMLGEAVLKAIPCSHPGCKTDYQNHTSDLVMFLSCKKDCTNQEAKKDLQDIVDQGAGKDGIDGFAFVKSEYRILP